MKPPFSTNVWLPFCRLSGRIVVPSLWAGFALFLAEDVIRTLLQDSTSNGPCKGGVSVNELMYNQELIICKESVQRCIGL